MPKKTIILTLLLSMFLGNLQAQSEEITLKTHNPKRAALYSAILPGLGQGYNKKYWKIPVIYAGIGTISYFAISNNNEYKIYKKAYDYKTEVNTDVGDDIKELADRYTADNLISMRDYYRRNTELSWIILAIWYGLNIIDATVDAHFFYYDIGDDLSLSIDHFNNTCYNYSNCGLTTGLTFRLNF